MLLCYQLFYRTLQKKEIESWKMMVVSLGIYVILQNIVSIIWGDKRVSMKSWEVLVGHEIMGGFITDVQIISIAVCSIVVIISVK